MLHWMNMICLEEIWGRQIPFIINWYISICPNNFPYFLAFCHDCHFWFPSFCLFLHHPWWLQCSCHLFLFHSLPLMVFVEFQWRCASSLPPVLPNPNTTSEEETLHMWLHERKRRTSGEKTTHEWKYHVPLSYPTQFLWQKSLWVKIRPLYVNAWGPCLLSIVVLNILPQNECIV